MSIKDWPEGERPREKLLARGADALSDAELLAVLLRIGTQGMSAVDLARSLLQNYGGLGGVMHATQSELAQHKGMGSAAYAQFAAVLEIGRRVLSEELRQLPNWAQRDKLHDYLRLQIGRETVEVTLALFTAASGELIASETITRGTVDANMVFPREVARRALQLNATSVILAHNHPSGDATPSPNDAAFTQHLQQVLALLDIILLDHFIVTAQQVISLRDKGLML